MDCIRKYPLLSSTERISGIPRNEDNNILNKSVSDVKQELFKIRKEFLIKALEYECVIIYHTLCSQKNKYEKIKACITDAINSHPWLKNESIIYKWIYSSLWKQSCEICNTLTYNKAYNTWLCSPRCIVIYKQQKSESKVSASAAGVVCYHLDCWETENLELSSAPYKSFTCTYSKVLMCNKHRQVKSSL